MRSRPSDQQRTGIRAVNSARKYAQPTRTLPPSQYVIVIRYANERASQVLQRHTRDTSVLGSEAVDPTTPLTSHFTHKARPKTKTINFVQQKANTLGLMFEFVQYAHRTGMYFGRWWSGSMSPKIGFVA